MNQKYSTYTETNGTRLTQIKEDTSSTSQVHMPEYNCYKHLALQNQFFWKFLQNQLETATHSYEKIVAGTSYTNLSSFRNVNLTLHRPQYKMMPQIPRNIDSLTSNEKIEKSKCNDLQHETEFEAQSFDIDIGIIFRNLPKFLNTTPTYFVFC